jgi:hypothetical protein
MLFIAACALATPAAVLSTAVIVPFASSPFSALIEASAAETTAVALSSAVMSIAMLVPSKPDNALAELSKAAMLACASLTAPTSPDASPDIVTVKLAADIFLHLLSIKHHKMLIIGIIIIVRVVIKAVEQPKKHPRILSADLVGQQMMVLEEHLINIPQSTASARLYSFFDDNAST